MPDPAFTLAAMRACGTATVSERDRVAAEAAATRLGRRVVEVGDAGSSDGLTLGFADGYEPNPADGVFAVRRLSPIPLVTLAVCLGLCWAEADTAPYPGIAVSRDSILQTTGALDAPASHVLGALRNELTMARLIEMSGATVSLGPAIAAWTDAQVDALRRYADILPRSTDA
jgi:hypothetical protein